MGHYTDFYFKAKLNLSRDVADFVTTSLIMTNIESAPPEHEFFKCERWTQLFCEDSSFYNKTQSISQNIERRYYTVEIWSCFKNYDNEVEKFLEWIKPFVIGRKKKIYLGWWMVEGMDHRFNEYKKQ